MILRRDFISNYFNHFQALTIFFLPRKKMHYVSETNFASSIPHTESCSAINDVSNIASNIKKTLLQKNILPLQIPLEQQNYFGTFLTVKKRKNQNIYIKNRKETELIKPKFMNALPQLIEVLETRVNVEYKLIKQPVFFNCNK